MVSESSAIPNDADGGLSKDCRTTSAGNVACGGQWQSNASINTAE